MPQYLKEYYEQKAQQLQLDIEHLNAQIEHETDPRELAALRQLKMQMVNERMTYIGAIDA